MSDHLQHGPSRQFKVRLAEGPTRVMNALYAGPKSWASLRDDHGATSADMDLLLDMRLVKRAVDGTWNLTADGRNSMVSP